MHRLYLHVVWTTWQREPRITAPAAMFLSTFLPAIARQEDADVLGMGIVSTHLHLLIRVSPTTSLPRLLQRMKGGSGVAAQREQVVPAGTLKWAKGYSVHSVGPRQLDPVMAYVKAQADRHPDQRIPGWPPAGIATP